MIVCEEAVRLSPRSAGSGSRPSARDDPARAPDFPPVSAGTNGSLRGGTACRSLPIVPRRVASWLAGREKWGSQVTAPGADSDCEPVVLWWLGERRFATPLEVVLEVTPVAALADLPDAHGPKVGHLDLRGTAVSSFDARRLLGMRDRDVARSDRFLITKVGAGRIALLVDRVEGIGTACREPGTGPSAERDGLWLARLQGEEGADPEGAPLVQILDPAPLLAEVS